MSRSEAPHPRTGVKILNAGMTQFVETVNGDLFEPMDVSDSRNIFPTLRRPRHHVALWWAERLAPRRPVLAKEAHVLVQDVFRCHVHGTTIRFARCLVAIPLGRSPGGALNQLGVMVGSWQGQHDVWASVFSCLHSFFEAFTRQMPYNWRRRIAFTNGGHPRRFLLDMGRFHFRIAEGRAGSAP